jgi:hypothetical protein
VETLLYQSNGMPPASTAQVQDLRAAVQLEGFNQLVEAREWLQEYPAVLPENLVPNGQVRGFEGHISPVYHF